MITLIQTGKKLLSFGRMDDVQTFKNTKRMINLSWTIPSHSEDEAISNFQEVSKLISFTYPVYEPIRTEVKNVDDDKEVNYDGIVQNTDKAITNLLQSLKNTENAGDREAAILFAAVDITDNILGSNKENNSSNNNISTREVGIISSPPILRLKFLNWSSDSENKGLYRKS